MYDGCPELLESFSPSSRIIGNLTPKMIAWNDMLQFYRGRNEHEVATVKNGRRALGHSMVWLICWLVRCIASCNSHVCIARSHARTAV